MPTEDPFQAGSNPLFETHFRAITEPLAGNGILAPGDFEVTATATDLQIQVATGTAVYGGSTVSLGSAETHTLSSGGTDDRWDTVYFDTGAGSSGVREGTAGTYPVPPDITGDEILLATVYVAAGATDVSDAEIRNYRGPVATAADLRYGDSTGAYGVSTIGAALDELQEASQIGAYPIQNSDLANSTVSVAGNSVGLGGSTAVDHADLSNIGPADHHTRPSAGLGLTEQSDTFEVDTGAAFRGSEGGPVSDNDQGIVEVEALPDGRTASVHKATCIGTDGGVTPIPSSFDMELVTFPDSGGYNVQATLIAGDGSTLYDTVSGDPLGSYTNSSGGEQTVGVIVNNQSGGSVEVYASFDGFR